MTHRRRSLAIALVAAASLSACTAGDGRDEGRAGASTHEDPPTTTGPLPVLADWGIPELPLVDIGPIGDGAGAWSPLRVIGDRLFAYRVVGDGVVDIVRIEPSSGAVLAQAQLSEFDSMSATTGSLLVTHHDQHQLDVLEPDTLALRHRIEMPADARVSLNVDGPRSEDLWLGARRYDEDQLAGRYTLMAAIHVDVATGEILEVLDVPPCGASTVAEAGPDRLVSGIVCAHTIDSIDRRTGEIESTSGFPVAVQQIEYEGDLWMRWKPFGYVARLRDAAQPHPFRRLRTLDLNADGPTLHDVAGFTVTDDVVWVAGEATDTTSPFVLFAIDPDEFVVRARAWVPSTVAIIGTTGYVMRDGRLLSADLRDVTGGAPRTVVRPSRGAPPAVEADTADEREIIETFTTVFDHEVPNEEVLPLIEGGNEVADVRTRLIDLVHSLYPDVELRVTAIAVDGDTASVVYVFLQHGVVAFVPLTGTLDRVGGRWLVSRESVCQLATSAAIAAC